MRSTRLALSILCGGALLAQAGSGQAGINALKVGDMVSVQSAQPFIWLGNARITAITQKKVTVETKTDAYTFALAAVSIRPPLQAPAAPPPLAYGPMGYAPQFWPPMPYAPYAGPAGVPPAPGPAGPEAEAPSAGEAAAYDGNYWLPGYGYGSGYGGDPYYWWRAAYRWQQRLGGRDAFQPPLGRPVMANPGLPVMAEPGPPAMANPGRPAMAHPGRPVMGSEPRSK